MAVHVAYHLTLETAFLNDAIATYPEDAVHRFLSHPADIASPFETPSREKDKETTDSVLSLSRTPKEKDKDTPDITALSSSPFLMFPRKETRHSATASLRQRDPELHNPDTPWLRQSLLLGQCWLADQRQCLSPEVLHLQYYTANDRTLGQFLLENCFNTRLKCPDEKCQRTVLQHTLSYSHGQGRLVITTQATQPMQDSRMLMWSKCTVCQRTSPGVVMSEQTFALSFGKFLEFTFYNTTAISRTPGCGHVLFGNHERYFGLHNLVAIFKYEKTEPHRIRLAQLQKLPAFPALRVENRQKELAQFGEAMYQVFAAILMRMGKLEEDLHLTPEAESDLQRLGLVLRLAKSNLKRLLETAEQRASIDMFALGWLQKEFFDKVHNVWLKELDRLSRQTVMKMNSAPVPLMTSPSPTATSDVQPLPSPSPPALPISSPVPVATQATFDAEDRKEDAARVQAARHAPVSVKRNSYHARVTSSMVVKTADFTSAVTNTRTSVRAPSPTESSMTQLPDLTVSTSLESPSVNPFPPPPTPVSAATTTTTAATTPIVAPPSPSGDLWSLLEVTTDAVKNTPDDGSLYDKFLAQGVTHPHARYV